MADYNCPYSAGGTIRTCTAVRQTGRVLATVTLDMTAATSDLTYTAKRAGADGDLISVIHIDPTANDAELAVTVDGTAITVSLATGVAGAITSTAAEVKAAILASPAASALVTCEDEGAGTGVVNALAVAFLATGAYAGCPRFDNSAGHCTLYSGVAHPIDAP